MRVKNSGALTIARKTMKPAVAKLLRPNGRVGVLHRDNLKEAISRGHNNRVKR